MPDHFGLWPVFTPLVAASARAQRLRFGVQVLNNEFWNPALLAREAAAADVLTGGRLELGFGAGHAQAEFEAVGVAYRRPAARVARLEQSLRIVRRLLAGERVNATGTYTLIDCETNLRPVQDPVPLMVGGNGDRVLTLGAREADGVGFTGFRSSTGHGPAALSHFSWDGLADRVGLVVRQSQHRSSPPERSVLIQRVQITDNPGHIAAEMVPDDPAAAEGLLDNPFVILGPDAFVTAQLRRLRDELGVTYFTTFEAFAPDLAAAARPLRADVA